MAVMVLAACRRFGPRRCPVLDARLVALGHNTARGAAGAAILNAELLAAEGWLVDGVTPW